MYAFQSLLHGIATILTVYKVKDLLNTDSYKNEYDVAKLFKLHKWYTAFTFRSIKCKNSILFTSECQGVAYLGVNSTKNPTDKYVEYHYTTQNNHIFSQQLFNLLHKFLVKLFCIIISMSFINPLYFMPSFDLHIYIWL